MLQEIKNDWKSKWKMQVRRPVSDILPNSSPLYAFFKAKNQLLALKKELKRWEREFERKNGRKPSRVRSDISSNSSNDSYYL